MSSCSLFCLQGLAKRETCFTSKRPPNEIMSKIEEAAKPMGFNVNKRNYKVLIRYTYVLVFV